MRYAEKWLEDYLQNSNITYYQDYAEGQGYTLPEGSKGILAYNWNNETRYENNRRVEVNKNNERISKIAEKLGFEIEWEDCFTRCDGCYKAIKTNPSSMDWTPQYFNTNSDVFCPACTDVREAVGYALKTGEELPDFIVPDIAGYFIVEPTYKGGPWNDRKLINRDHDLVRNTLGIKKIVVISGVGIAVRKRDLKKVIKFLNENKDNYYVVYEERA